MKIKQMVGIVLKIQGQHLLIGLKLEKLKDSTILMTHLFIKIMKIMDKILIKGNPINGMMKKMVFG